MNTPVKRDIVQIVCAASGVLCVIVLFVGLWPVAGFLPPPSPHTNAEELAAIYHINTTGIRIGAILVLVSGALTAPIVALISGHLRRIERDRMPVLTYLQLVTGAGGLSLFVVSGALWTAAAFRPERAADFILVLNDLAWVFFVMIPFMAVVQNFAIGAAFLTDRTPQPPFPRWLGYFNLWTAICLIPGCIAWFFKTGPFAWNGLIAFWLPAVVFGFWLVAMVTYLIRNASMPWTLRGNTERGNSLSRET